MKFFMLFNFWFVFNYQLHKNISLVYFPLDRNPLSKLNLLIGNEVKVGGYIKRTINENQSRIWTIGRITTSRHPKTEKDTLLIVIRGFSLKQFDNIKDGTLLNAFIIVTGKLSKHRNKLELILTDQRNLYITKFKDFGPVH